MSLLNASERKRWSERVLSADNIYMQVKIAMEQAGVELPKSPRCPDVRMVLDNISGLTQIFANPANHANDKAETIPAQGEKTAAMIMLAGDTLVEQQEIAARLFEKFDLANKGLSREFVAAIKQDGAGGVVREAYGPAPFAGQVSNLVDLAWKDAGGQTTTITPFKGLAAAYGARAPGKETAFAVRVNIAVQGTSTIAENVEGTGMVIVVDTKWDTGEVSTRPVVPSIAKEFYGEHYDSLPIVTVSPEEFVQKIDLMNGTVIDVNAPEDERTYDPMALKIA